MAKVFVVFDRDAEKDGRRFFKVLPKVAVFTLTQQVLQQRWVGVRTELGSGSGLCEFVDVVEGSLDSTRESFVDVFAGLLGALHL